MNERERMDYFKQRLDYNPDTGKFVWRRNRVEAGSLDDKGYIFLRHKHLGKIYKLRAHRLAWYVVYGEIPLQIDHVDRRKDNNRISNLRIATSRENQLNRSLQSNNTSGYTGVHLDKRSGRWLVYHGKAREFVGSFLTREQAAIARQHYIDTQSRRTTNV